MHPQTKSCFKCVCNEAHDNESKIKQKQQQALAKSSNVLERISKRKTNKRKDMPSIFRLTPKKIWK